MSEETHPYRCPACETTIRATNLEWCYEDEEYTHGVIISSKIPSFWVPYDPTDEKEQMWFCPNEECRVKRVIPGDPDE